MAVTSQPFYSGMSYVNPGVSGYGPAGQPGIAPIVGQLAGAALGGIIRNLATGSSSTATTGNFPTFPQGADIDIQSQQEACAGVGRKQRRRRRKLLTCGDKADIAFLYGQLGGGQLGRAAITSLLSRRCS